MKNVIKTLKEQITNISLASRVGNFETKSKNSSNYLGNMWEIIGPIIQIAVYWFVFTSIMQRTDITANTGESIKYIYWMLIGYTVWLFINKAIIDASSSIYSRLGILTKMEYPIASVPLIPITKNLLTHLKLLIAAYLIIVIAGGYLPTLKLLQLIYIVPLMLLFLSGLGLITSTISTIIRDFHQMLSAVMKMLLYVSPILWQVTMVGGEMGKLLVYNPIYYFVEVYRAAIFGTEWYPITHIKETTVIIVVTLVVYVIGSLLHQKLRKNFVDFA